MILKELSEAAGVSGQEDAVRDIILNAIAGHVRDVRIDAIGNITAVKKSKSRKKLPRVLLAAHMDEIGFMVSGFDSNGLIRVVNVGGIDPRILPALRVKIGKDSVPGVFIWAPIHLSQDENVVKLSNLRIDIGTTTKDAAKGKVKLGDRVVFDAQFMKVGKHILRGRALDDRVGCALLIDILQADSYPVDVLAAFTTQEEIGVRGAQVAAKILKPDVAFVLETTPAGDIPDPEREADDDDDNHNPSTKLAHGPALTVIDSRMITDPRILNYQRQTAEKAGIPYQLKTVRGGGTDAGAIHTANAGIPSGVVSVPARYIHSPAAYIHRDDYANALKLLQALINNLSWDVLKRT